MPSTKLRPSSIPKSIEAFAERKLPKSEETDCQKRGYTLSNVTLGRGAYAKVKLGFVTAMKLRSDRYLRDQLRKQGNVKVTVDYSPYYERGATIKNQWTYPQQKALQAD